MNRSTVHLACNLIRYHRGMLTAIDKWIAQQEPCKTNLELSAVTAIMRDILTSFETQIGAVEVDREVVETK